MEYVLISVHCDKKRGNKPIEILDPHKASFEELITYNLQGYIVPSGNEVEKVNKDISTLGLNCKKLIDGRIAAKDEVWERFLNEHDKNNWSKDLFLERAQFYRTKQLKRGKMKFHAYCNYIAWYFEYYETIIRTFNYGQIVTNEFVNSMNGEIIFCR